MKKGCISILFFASIIVPFYAFSFQNPTEKFNVFKGFGELDDGYNTGIDIVGEQPVYAVSDGEIIFYCDEESGFSDLPSGMGSFAVVDHGKQIRASYYHLKRESIGIDDFIVRTGEQIGLTGATGADSSSWLHFEIYDGEMQQLVNPLLMVNGSKDKTPPDIKNVFLIGEDSSVRLEYRHAVKAGIVSLKAEITDRAENRRDADYTAPFKISVFLNGEGLFNYEYNVIKMKDGKFILDTVKKTADSYYTDFDKPMMVTLGDIDLKPGNIGLEIETSDFYGNKSVKNYLLMVR